MVPTVVRLRMGLARCTTPTPRRTARPHAPPWRHDLLCLVVVFAAACTVYDPQLAKPQLDSALASAGRPATAQRSDPVQSSVQAIDCTEGTSLCTRPHALSVCVEGACLVLSCEANRADCDGLDDNGCEAALNSVDNCGLCSAACRFNHAAGSCTDGKCTRGACDPRFADCDADPANGCERPIDRPSDCGACSRACPAPAHGSAVCDEGKCGVRCDRGHGDCNGRLEDGCEQALNDDAHCGRCDARCGGAHVSGSRCENAACTVVSCEAGYADCNRDAADGCEVSMSSPEHCGSCDRKCELPHVARESCELRAGAMTCGIDKGCAAGETDCKPDDARGCDPGFADCDGKPDNGCETDLTRPTSCGKCGNDCSVPNTLTDCEGGSCVTTGCLAGYGQCDKTNGCQSLQSDPNNCGQCGKQCNTATERCSGGRCSELVCEQGSGDCDENAQNGCEADLKSLEHCGGCDLRCSGLAHVASSSCSMGSCKITSCQADWGDCDADSKNGCETDLNTQAHCGACKAACTRSQAEARCDAGQCKLTSCSSGREDCNKNAADGCEADLSAAGSCGTCANDCNALANVTAARCQASSTCTFECKGGFADCDGMAANGCETNLGNSSTCGSCTSDCRQLTNAQDAVCESGQCRALGCQAGFGDCDQNAANGCEQALNASDHCGACGRPCALPHASSACSSGSCVKGACDSGWGDCDGDPANGCEAELSTPQHCGTCEMTCQGSAECVNGRCGCTRDDQCGQNERCCNNQCVNVEGQCSVFPCLPGQARDGNRANCGACGTQCRNCCVGF